MSVAGRMALALAAVAAAFWLALALHSARLQTQATGTAFQDAPPSASTFERSVRRARDARRFVPDAGAKLTESVLLLRERHFRRAESVLREIVREEPANFDAWHWLSLATRDRSVAREARRRMAELRRPRS